MVIRIRLTGWLHCLGSPRVPAWRIPQTEDLAGCSHGLAESDVLSD